MAAWVAPAIMAGGSILGGMMGGKGDKKQGSSSAQYPPEMMAMLSHLANSIYGGFGESGSLFGQPHPNLYSLSPEGESIRQQMMSMGNLEGLEKTLAPKLTNQFTAMGMGRSGAFGEALASAYAEKAPQLQQFAMGAAQLPKEMEKADFLRRQGWLGQLYSRMPGVGQTGGTQSQTGQGMKGGVGDMLPLASLFGGQALQGLMGGGSKLPDPIYAMGAGSTSSGGGFL